MIKKTAFTLMELMVVVVLVGLMATFAIPSYTKMITKSTERSVILGVETILAAERIYFARYRNYWPGDAAAYYFIADINSGLSIDMVEPDGITYQCKNQDGTYQSVRCGGRHNDGWAVRADTTILNGHPFCSVGTCPSCKDAAGGGC